ncbi:MAG: biotin--[acetyl-CoA-carboxylase] ligase [Balneolaceae bacterium]|nr:biotin--[acetyl-CoA-carboxylase] ligase [Balneolaceae bacterium]
MFDHNLFNKELSTSWLGRELFYYPELSSTNDHAKKIINESSLHGSLIVADHQTAGKGQHQRKWDAEPGQNLTFSIIFEPQKGERLSILTLACALAVCEYIDENLPETAWLKWPNDVLIGGKKVSGLLTETVFKGDKLERLVIGIGVNINQQTFENELANSATSFSLLDKNTHQRELVLARLLTRIEYFYRLWSTQNSYLIKRINSKLIGYGKWIRLEVDGREVNGEFKLLGINESGHLLVLNKELEVNTFSYEQVRVRFDSKTS